MPHRSYASTANYRFGFNGQEKNNEAKGLGNSYSSDFWEFDSRIGRRWNIDPKPTTGISFYSTFSNNPILFCDPLGDTTVVGAGGTQSVEIDEKQNSLEFYQPGAKYNISGTQTPVPVKPGQLRSFSNSFGKFTARWDSDANGNAFFSGYTNDKNQTLDEVVLELTELANGWKGKILSFGNFLQGEHDKDPVAFNLKITTTLLSTSLMAAIEPVGYSKGYNPSFVTQESMSGIGFVKSTPTFAEGSFSIINWKGYPNLGFKPTGPFRLLEGAEYADARTLANKTNAAIHKNAPYLKSLQIHEIIPVKFGGSPTDYLNKIYLTPSQHAEYTNFWNSLMRGFK